MRGVSEILPARSSSMRVSQLHPASMIRDSAVTQVVNPRQHQMTQVLINLIRNPLRALDVVSVREKWNCLKNRRDDEFNQFPSGSPSLECSGPGASDGVHEPPRPRSGGRSALRLVITRHPRLLERASLRHGIRRPILPAGFSVRLDNTVEQGL